MVTLRKASSPILDQSSSHTNTPESNSRSSARPLRKTQAKENQRKSVRVQRRSTAGPWPRRSLGEQTSKYDQSKPSESSSATSTETAEPGETTQSASAKARRTSAEHEAAADRPEHTSSAEVDGDGSGSSEKGSIRADALALLEAKKYRPKTSRRRRAEPLVSEPLTEEECLELIAQVEAATLESEMARAEKRPAELGEISEDSDDEDRRNYLRDRAEARKTWMKTKLSRGQDSEIPSRDGDSVSKSPTKKVVVANTSPPASTSTAHAVTKAEEDLPVDKNDPTPKTTKLQVQSVTQSEALLDLPLETSSRTRRKRSASPAVTKPGKRRKAAVETRLKESVTAEPKRELHCFEVVVYGDADATVKVEIPSRLQRSRTPLGPELVPLHVMSVIRSSNSDKTKWRATYTAYAFHLPDRRRHESFDKVQIKIYGKTAKAPSRTDGFVNKAFEDGSVRWRLEADEERCRWKKV